MLVDLLENAHRCHPLNGRLARAFEFLAQPGRETLPSGRVAIDGDRLYATVAREPGRRKADGRLEAHVRYLDIQCVLAGTEEMGWKPLGACRDPEGPYDAANDVRFFRDSPEVWLTVRPGRFVIFFPEDAHMPMISPAEVHKIVVKVAVDE